VNGTDSESSHSEDPTAANSTVGQTPNSESYKYAYDSLSQVPEGSTYDWAQKWMQPGSEVLDIGSGPGHFAASVKKALGCSVDCLEYNDEAASRAALVCRQVFQVDLLAPGWASAIDRRYDHVLLLDVLEHMVDPVATLREASSLLAADGTLMVSVPNVAHGAVRLPLMAGEWTYESEGILDDSHLRFFVLPSFLEMLAEAGLTAQRLERVYRTVSDEWVDRLSNSLGTSAARVSELLSSTEGNTWQFIAQARPSAESQAAVPAPQTTLDRSDDLIGRVHQLESELASYRRRYGWMQRLLSKARSLIAPKRH